MSTEKFEELPPEIVHNGKTYVKRLMELDHFVVIEYSTEQVMTRHLYKPGTIAKFTEDYVNKALLAEAVESTIDKAVEEIKKKIQPYLPED